MVQAISRVVESSEGRRTAPTPPTRSATRNVVDPTLTEDDRWFIEESGLIQNAQEGDRESFACLVERYWDRLYRWLFHLTHDPHLAEDLTQETFLKALAAIDSFRVGTNFRAWLFRIGHNNFVNLKRSERNQKRTLTLEMPDRGQGPEESVLNRETLQNVLIAVHKLPSDFRAALLLRVEEGLSFREIADIQEITEETARWRVFKARQKLMQVLGAELISPPEAETKRKST